MFWRGSTTGCQHRKLTWRVSSHRVRLHFLVNDPAQLGLDDTLTVLLEQSEDEEGGAGLRMKTLSRSEFNQAFMDVGLVGPAIICGKGEKDEACDEMEKEVGFLPRVSMSARKEVTKYMVDVGEQRLDLHTYLSL